MKALFLDIDGTLVSFTSHRIPDSALEMLQKVKKQGNKIFIATGRPKSIINNLQQLEELDLIDGMVTMNGGYVFVGNDVLFRNAVPPTDMAKIVNYTQSKGVTNVFMTHEHAWITRNSDVFREIFYGLLQVAPIQEIDESDEMKIALREGGIYQITTYLNNEDEQELMASLSGSESTRWHPTFADIMGKGNTKRKGLEEICKYFNITREDCYAFGDGGNDIEMLQWAGHGIAMGNANDMVKQAADWVAPHIDNDGLATAIERFKLNK